MLRVLGLMPTVVPFENLEAKHPTGSKGTRTCSWSTFASCRVCRARCRCSKRQFPNAGVVIVARTLDPAVMLEAMRSGVTEWVTEPLSAAELDAAIRRVAKPAGESAAPARLSRSWARKGGLGSTTVAVERRDGAAEGVAPADPGDGSPPRARRRVAATSASSRASRSSTRSKTSTGSTRPTSRVWSTSTKAGRRSARVVGSGPDGHRRRAARPSLD